ncbi:MAG: hypothetical protein ACK41D_09220 [Rubricoccaceae bacterium]
MTTTPGADLRADAAARRASEPAPGAPLVYRALGQYDAAFEAVVWPDGRFRTESGSYVTRGVREGHLARGRHAALRALARAVAWRDYEAPPGAEGFGAEITWGARRVRWWGPAAAADPALGALVRALAAL